MLSIKKLSIIMDTTTSMDGPPAKLITIIISIIFDLGPTGSTEPGRLKKVVSRIRPS